MFVDGREHQERCCEDVMFLGMIESQHVDENILRSHGRLYIHVSTDRVSLFRGRLIFEHLFLFLHADRQKLRRDDRGVPAVQHVLSKFNLNFTK